MPGHHDGARRFRWALVTAIAFGLSIVPATAASANTVSTVNQPVRTTGCRQAPPVVPGTSTIQQVHSGGLTREYLLHLPASYQPNRLYPLVLSFHGHKRTSHYQEQLSEFSELDTIAVYPQGLIGTDGGSAWTGAPYSAAADDVLFTSDLLTSLQRKLCVDPARIYATGKSNGGGFVGVLACRLPGRIAAFAPVSGAYYPEGGACDPSRSAPILAFHGTADATIPYAGNPAKGLPAIQDWLAGWAQRNCGGGGSPRRGLECYSGGGSPRRGLECYSGGGSLRRGLECHCLPWPLSYSPMASVQVQRWIGCRSTVVHYRVEGAGHVWPSTHPNNDSATPTVIDATPVIWAFFRAHRLT